MSIQNVQDIKLEPVSVLFGTRQEDKITTVADVSGSLEGTFFLIKSARNETTYEVQLHRTSATLVTSGATLVEVLYTTDDSAATLAGLIQAAVDALDDFNASVSDDEVTIEASSVGATDAAVDGSSATGFSFVESRESFGADLGATEGVTFGMEFEDVQVTADQTGGQVLDLINRAVSVEVTATFKELSKGFWETILGRSRGSVAGAGDTAAIGLGDSKRFLNQSQFAGELILKPINEASDDRNFHFWLAIPNPSGPNLDGSDLSVMEVVFTALRDSARQDARNIMVFGDGKSGYKK